MFKFLSRFRKAAAGETDPLDESACMGDDPYLAQIATALVQGESTAESGAHSTIQDKARRTRNADIS
ncbi:hypothetical protein G3O06_04685 [Burkholderia sp. Ac-20345]|uniref:hypothetical protein n=1 Tax=Burkholderia sp. Ac-20345 TaxID=2703891 RepID=UPI00197BB6E3|nr:hypothetical protein [Burkholderia sp. Ac-20345]MBN3776866.1 hypothetical protein [Burkholderia sp. Ac-20345]